MLENNTNFFIRVVWGASSSQCLETLCMYSDCDFLGNPLKITWLKVGDPVRITTPHESAPKTWHQNTNFVLWVPFPKHINPSTYLTIYYLQWVWIVFWGFILVNNLREQQTGKVIRRIQGLQSAKRRRLSIIHLQSTEEKKNE